MDIRAGEQFTIRKKLLKLFGDAFYIYDTQERIVGYCKQKAFRLREDIRIYTDESCSRELFVISTGQILDIGATYTIRQGDGRVLGAMRRKGLKSSFYKDEWVVLSADGAEVGLVAEEGTFLPLLRKWLDFVSIFFPQAFDVKVGGQSIARFRQHFNLISYRMGVAYKVPSPVVPMELVLAGACLVCAIEGRQN
jgi:uncharacterized protein YxjI